MARYFCSLRSLKGDALDKNGVIRAFTEGVSGCDMPFQTVAESFHLIESNTHTVYVPFDEGSALIERLAAGECSRALYRALGRYAVSVYEPHFQALYAAGAILTAQDVPTLDSGSAILRDMVALQRDDGPDAGARDGESAYDLKSVLWDRLTDKISIRYKRERRVFMAIQVEVWGEYACFTRPEMKTERVSYDCMTPSAARGLLESIYWHPG